MIQCPHQGTQLLQHSSSQTAASVAVFIRVSLFQLYEYSEEPLLICS